MDELEELITRTVSIPSVPQVFARLQQVVSDPDSSIPEAVKVVEDDPGLAARCLQLANSAAYALKVRSSSLKQAASVLGMKALRDVALQTSLVVTYSHLSKHAGFSLGQFWRHGAVTAVTARHLARHSPALRGVDKEALASCGLLHNIGRLAMLDGFRDDYLRVIGPVGNHGPEAVKAESEAFGFDHAQVGAILAANWQMGDAIVESARDHHLAAGGGAPVLHEVIGFANLLAHAVMEGGAASLAAMLESPAAAPYRLPRESLAFVVDAIVESSIEAVSAHA